jgi:hypothetical protein
MFWSHLFFLSLHLLQADTLRKAEKAGAGPGGDCELLMFADAYSQ